MSENKVNSYKKLSLWLAAASLICCFVSSGCAMRENARNLKIDGLIKFVCRGEATVASQSNVCGNRSVWLEADSGIIAYVTVYGISSLEEAKPIASFIKKLKEKHKQNISVQVAIYSSSRNIGREPSAYKILEDNI